MFEPLSSVFSRKEQVFSWQESEIKHFIETYIQERTKSNQVYCQTAAHGKVVVRVVSAVHQQEVRLLEYDLRDLLQKEAKFTMKELRVLSV